MDYKTILVHVEPSEAAETSLRVAAGLAQSFGALLFGLGARAFDIWPDPTGMSTNILHEAITTDLREAEEAFRRHAAPLGANTKWQGVTDFPTDAILKQCFAADLIVASRPADPAPPQTTSDIGSVVLQSGVPVLLATPGTETLDVRRVMVAWKNTREARRAVRDALPFLKRAEEVTAVAVPDAAKVGPMETELAQLCERLRRHGVNARGEVRAAERTNVAEDLIAIADSLSADLIVAGAYGYSRLREWAFGGVTRDLLRRSPKPVLFGH